MDFRELIIKEFKGPQTDFCITTEFERVKKHKEHAKSMRDSGNRMFLELKHTGKMHERIWDSYLYSIAASEPNSEELALSYNNMSALLYHLCKYEDCIKDIDRALKITNLDSRRVKLLCRKAKCLKALGKPEMESVFQDAKSWFNKIDDEDPLKESLKDVISKVRGVLDKVKKGSINETDINKLQIENAESDGNPPKNETDQTDTIPPEVKDQETGSKQSEIVSSKTYEPELQENQNDTEQLEVEDCETNAKKLECQTNQPDNVLEKSDTSEPDISHINVKSGKIDAKVLQEQGKVIGIDISKCKFNQTGLDEFEMEINNCTVKYTSAHCDDSDEVTRKKPTASGSSKKKKKKKKKKTKKTYKTEHPHLEILNRKEKQNIFDSVSLKYTDTHGRHLIATRDIKPGEIICVTKPYVVVPNFHISQHFCNNCLKIVWSSIPCENCPCSMYCSETCKEEAQQMFHDIECEVLQFVVFGRETLDYQIQVSLRAVIKGVKEFGSIANLKDEIEFMDSSTTKDYDVGFSRDGKFRPNSFVSIFGFKNIYVGHEDLGHLARYCCRAVIGLAKFTTFFGENQKFEKVEDFIESEDAVFIGTLLLRVAVIVYNNGMKVTPIGAPCNYKFEPNPCMSVTPCCERGYSLNTITHLIPHSCDPNVKLLKTEGSKEILYCTQPIFKGDSLFECYRSTFFELEPEHRYEATAQVLNRYCNCQACEEEWPAVLISDGKLLSFEQLFELVIESREYEYEKQRLYDLASAYGLFHQNIVDELSLALEASFDYFGQPSAEVCAAIYLLNFTFNELYGIKYRMPIECRVREK